MSKRMKSTENLNKLPLTEILRRARLFSKYEKFLAQSLKIGRWLHEQQELVRRVKEGDENAISKLGVGFKEAMK